MCYVNAVDVKKYNISFVDLALDLIESAVGEHLWHFALSQMCIADYLKSIKRYIFLEKNACFVLST